MTIIPDNNLPIYLQKYSLSILCQNPNNLCPDTPVLGGCKGTAFGCCPDQLTPKRDAAGTNCPPTCGSVLYSTVGLIPSNKVAKRVWNLTVTGRLRPHDGDYVFLYDFSNVDYGHKTITFENALSGTILICGHVLDASRVADYDYCDSKSLLKIILKSKKLGFKLKRDTNVFMNLFLDDSVPEVCVFLS